MLLTVYGDGNAVIMEGRQAQEAFYDAYRRQTADGAYPRPSPGTRVVDEVARCGPGEPAPDNTHLFRFCSVLASIARSSSLSVPPYGAFNAQ